MTAILPRNTEDVEAGVRALHDVCPGMTDEYLRKITETVIAAVHPRVQCVSVSPFHHDPCVYTDTAHKVHTDHRGRTWVDGSSMLKGKYSK